MKRISTYLFWAIIISGFILRFYTLPYGGTNDMASYYDWGLKSLINGLDESYHGIYFPFQYQLFEFGSWISTSFKIDYVIVFKSINLFFDCGNLVILYFILKLFRVSKFYLLIYWIHPWFLNMFSLGYCDFQFTFFILCTLYFTLKASSRDYLIAGIFLGFAFLMKPQVQIIFISFFIYSLISYYKYRNTAIFQIFIFPVILYADYSMFFFIKSIYFVILKEYYLHIADTLCQYINFRNQWFHDIFAHGFSTFMFAFFILTSLYFTLKPPTRNFFISSIFLGFAFLLKPQFHIVFICFLIFAIIYSLKSRSIKIYQIFILPVCIISGFFLLYLIKLDFHFNLANTYLDIANRSPSLNANSLNIWFPIAYHLKGPNDPIYIIQDDISIIGIKIRYLAILAVFILIFLFIRRIFMKKSQTTINFDLYLLACFSSLIVPNLMTCAHENHMFLATVLLIPFLGKIKSLLVIICIHIILLLQFLNLYGYYGVSEYKKLSFMNIPYSYESAYILSFVAVFAFLILLIYLLYPNTKFLTQMSEKPIYE